MRFVACSLLVLLVVTNNLSAQSVLNSEYLPRQQFDRSMEGLQIRYEADMRQQNLRDLVQDRRIENLEQARDSKPSTGSSDLQLRSPLSAQQRLVEPLENLSAATKDAQQVLQSGREAEELADFSAARDYYRNALIVLRKTLSVSPSNELRSLVADLHLRLATTLRYLEAWEAAEQHVIASVNEAKLVDGDDGLPPGQNLQHAKALAMFVFLARERNIKTGWIKNAEQAVAICVAIAAMNGQKTREAHFCVAENLLNIAVLEQTSEQTRASLLARAKRILQPYENDPLAQISLFWIFAAELGTGIEPEKRQAAYERLKLYLQSSGNLDERIQPLRVYAAAAFIKTIKDLKLAETVAELGNYLSLDEEIHKHPRARMAKIQWLFESQSEIGSRLLNAGNHLAAITNYRAVLTEARTCTKFFELSDSGISAYCRSWQATALDVLSYSAVILKDQKLATEVSRDVSQLRLWLDSRPTGEPHLDYIAATLHTIAFRDKKNQKIEDKLESARKLRARYPSQYAERAYGAALADWARLKARVSGWDDLIDFYKSSGEYDSYSVGWAQLQKIKQVAQADQPSAVAQSIEMEEIFLPKITERWSSMDSGQCQLKSLLIEVLDNRAFWDPGPNKKASYQKTIELVTEWDQKYDATVCGQMLRYGYSFYSKLTSLPDLSKAEKAALSRLAIEKLQGLYDAGFKSDDVLLDIARLYAQSSAWVDIADSKARMKLAKQAISMVNQLIDSDSEKAQIGIRFDLGVASWQVAPKESLAHFAEAISAHQTYAQADSNFDWTLEASCQNLVFLLRGDVGKSDRELAYCAKQLPEIRSDRTSTLIAQSDVLIFAFGSRSAHLIRKYTKELRAKNELSAYIRAVENEWFLAAVSNDPAAEATKLMDRLFLEASSLKIVDPDFSVIYTFMFRQPEKLAEHRKNLITLFEERIKLASANEVDHLLRQLIYHQSETLWQLPDAEAQELSRRIIQVGSTLPATPLDKWPHLETARINANRKLAYIMKRKSRIEEAKRFATEVLKISRALYDARNDCFYSYFLAVQTVGDVNAPDALNAWLEIFSAADQTDSGFDTQTKIDIRWALASLYSNNGMTALALVHFEEALKLSNAVIESQSAKFGDYSQNIRLRFDYLVADPKSDYSKWQLLSNDLSAFDKIGKLSIESMLDTASLIQRKLQALSTQRELRDQHALRSVEYARRLFDIARSSSQLQEYAAQEWCDALLEYDGAQKKALADEYLKLFSARPTPCVYSLQLEYLELAGHDPKARWPEFAAMAEAGMRGSQQPTKKLLFGIYLLTYGGPNKSHLVRNVLGNLVDDPTSEVAMLLRSLMIFGDNDIPSAASAPTSMLLDPSMSKVVTGAHVSAALIPVGGQSGLRLKFMRLFLSSSLLEDSRVKVRGISMLNNNQDTVFGEDALLEFIKEDNLTDQSLSKMSRIIDQEQYDFPSYNIWLELARVRANEGKYSDALDALTKVNRFRALNKEVIKYFSLRAWIYGLQGKTSDLIQVLEEAVAFSNGLVGDFGLPAGMSYTNLVNHQDLAYYYLKSGNKNEAEKHACKAYEDLDMFIVIGEFDKNPQKYQNIRQYVYKLLDNLGSDCINGRDHEWELRTLVEDSVVRGEEAVLLEDTN